MGLLIMTNAQMFTFSLGRNESFTMESSWEQFPPCGIFNSWRPIFDVGLKTRNVKRIRTSVLRRQYCGSVYAMAKEESDKREVGGGGLVLEKEFEFKPSFNEYLKTMESVKSDRETKQARKSGRNSLKDDSRGTRTPSLGKDDEDYVKLRSLEGDLDEEMVHKESCGEGNKVTVYKGVVEGKFDQQGSVIKTSKDKLGDNRRRVEAKVKTSRVDRVEGTLRHQNSNVELKGSQLTKVKKFQRAQNRPVLLVDDKMSGSNIDIIDKQVLDKSSLEMFATKSKSCERQKDDVRSSRMCSGTVERNCTESQKATNNESQRRSRKLMNSKKRNSFGLTGGDSSLEVERAAFNTFEEGNDVIDKPRAPRVEMEERIQKLARQLNGADIDVPEWMFSKMMRSAKIRFSDHSIMRVIQILGKLGNWRRVLQVIEWLQMRERFKSHRLRDIYTTALNVLGKARRPVEALNVFHAMQQQKYSYPDLVAYHCIAVTLGQVGHIRELFDVIDSMQSLPKKKFKTGTHERWDPRLEPDIVVYNAVLNACVRRKHWEGAFWVLQQLKEKGQKPSASTYGLVMEVMFACGKYNLVHDFFRKVQKSFIPNALVYKVIVNTLWRESKTDEAVLAVLDMERRGIVGSAALYYDLARCLCCAGRCQEALMQIERICKVANKPLVVTYTGLIQACLDSGHIENATFIFNQLKEFCSPNLVTCNIMLKAYLEHGLFEEADKLFKKMSEDSYRISSGSDNRGLVVPDIFTFNTMLDACVTEKRWDDFEYAYKRMLHHGFHFNAKRHLRMILNASRAGKVELLETTWKHLAQADRTPPPPLIKERFCISLQREDYISALSCITSHPVADIPEFSKMAWLNLFMENSRRFRDDTFVRLIHEASTLAMRSDSRNPALDNLISSCREFSRNHVTAPEMNVRQTLSKVV